MKSKAAGAITLAFLLSTAPAFGNTASYLPDGYCDADLDLIEKADPIIVTPSGFFNSDYSCRWNDESIRYRVGLKQIVSATCRNDDDEWSQDYLLMVTDLGVLTMRPTQTDMNATHFFLCTKGHPATTIERSE